MDAFARGISELGAHPDKQKIEVLQMVASDALGQAETISEHSRTLLDAIYTAEPLRKLTLIYVVDAITKMRGGREYQLVLEPEIAQCFVAAYHQVRPQTLTCCFCFVNSIILLYYYYYCSMSGDAVRCEGCIQQLFYLSRFGLSFSCLGISYVR
jgi:hypothetical protein